MQYSPDKETSTDEVQRTNKRIKLSGVRREHAAARLLGLRVRIPPVAWVCISLDRCVSSGRYPCYLPISSPEESYRLCYVIVCELTSKIWRLLRRKNLCTLLKSRHAYVCCFF